MLGIVILNYNGYQDTINCVESVLANNTYPSKYIIVDNASKDTSLKKLKEYFSSKFGDDFSCGSPNVVHTKISLIASPSNGGYARGNNLGLEYAADDEDLQYIMILNNDVLFVEDIIPSLIECIQSNPDAGVVSPLLYARDGQTVDYNCARLNPKNSDVIKTFLLQYKDWRGIISKTRTRCKILLNHPELMNEPVVPIELPSGSCMLLKKSVFKEIGWFDPNTFLYYEENILFKKLSRIGKQSYICPGLSCIHLGAQSTTKTPVPFLKKAEARSARYYLRQYGEMGMFESLVCSMSFGIFFTRARCAEMYHKFVLHDS